MVFHDRKLIKALCSDYRAIAPDHMGCGLSDKPDDTQYSYSLQQRSLDLEGLLDSLGISENITLVMHDWGGPIGMGYAIRHVGAISRLVALNTAAFLWPNGKPLHWSLRVGRNRPFGVLLIRGLNVMVLGATYLGSQSGLPREVRRSYAAPYNSWQNRISVLRFVQDIPLCPSDRSYPMLQNIDENLFRFGQTPLLICWGKRDFIFDDDLLEQWIKRFPASEVHQFPDAGHFVFEDDSDSIVALVRDFLHRHAARVVLDG